MRPEGARGILGCLNCYRADDTDGRAPETLVAVRRTEPVAEVALLGNISAMRKERIGEVAGRTNTETMEAISIALSAAIEL